MKFDADASVSNVTKTNQSISGTGPYDITVAGLSAFTSGADSIAIMIDLSNTTIDYGSKAEIPDDVPVIDNSVTGTYYSALIRSNNGPTAPTAFTF